MNQPNDPPAGGPNPYAPPAAGQTDWDPGVQAVGPGGEPAHTSIPKVFGVLSIVFASLVLLGSLIGSCTGCVGSKMSGLNKFNTGSGGTELRAQQAMLKHMGGVYSAIGIQSAIFAVMSGFLLAIGIGQLRYRRWARGWTVYWSGVAFVVLIGVVLLSIFLIGPAYQRMFDEMAKLSPSGQLPSQLSGSMSSLMGGTSGVMTVLFYAPYPILMLIYFTRDRVKAAMVK